MRFAVMEKSRKAFMKIKSRNKFFLLCIFTGVCLFAFSSDAAGDPQLAKAREKALLIRAKFRPHLQQQIKKDPPPAPVRTMSSAGKSIAGKISAGFSPQNVRNSDRNPVRNTGVQGKNYYKKSTPQPARTLQKTSAPHRIAGGGKTLPAKRMIAPKAVVTPRMVTHTAAPVRNTVRKEGVNTVKIRMIRVGKERYCYLNDVAKYYRMQMRYYKNGVELFAPGYSIRFYNEKRLGSIGHVPVSFLYAPLVRAKTQYFIHEKDIAILVSSIFSPLYAYRNVQTIMLDPGHGGTDYGALGKAIHEKQMNLNTALLVRAGLTALGYKVMMTRAKDQTLSLDNRIALCNRKKPDLYISLHCNAAINKNANGIETFAATPFGVPSSGKKTPANIKAPDPGNAFDRMNYRLAYEIQKALIIQTKANDRGVKVARYKVIRESSCPAALVEMGFITNENEQKKFIDPSYRKKLVDGIVLGIHNFARSLTIVGKPGR